MGSRSLQGTVDFFRDCPSIRPRKKRGLLGANGFSLPTLYRSPRVAAFCWRRIEGHGCFSTLPRRCSATAHLSLALLLIVTTCLAPARGDDVIDSTEHFF